ncbi:class I SAM-dependent methyltransferase [Ginsengibacter hankyongi]|uniref:Class I SAM-dependent methyltransferase n=1 Tax=Ginsengibacter hankyongi TaxID=2607284 RepID=A0A5J5IKV3_9BACT|nr:class I SAM-dependent methyltransferase [Ginsengibacter hankyongi]
MNCPVCNNSKNEIRFLKNGYRILHCLECDHLFTDFVPTPNEVEQIYSDDYFFKGGAGYDDYTLEKDMLIKRGEYYAGKINKFMRAGEVLDIGAAAGFLLKGFENKGWKGTGIEPNNSMVEYGKNVVGVNIRKGTVETIELEHKFDLIILVQVVAHIYDLQNSIDKIYNLLKPNGKVLIETWDKDSITARIFGKNWHEYSPPSTLNYFSKKTLNQLISQHNFSEVAHGTPKKSIHSKHAKSLIKHKLLESKGLKWMAGMTALIPGNMIIPYPSEDLFWTLYKKN